MQASLPSASASTQNDAGVLVGQQAATGGEGGGHAVRRPRRAATVTSMWMRLRCGRGASICWNQTAGPMREDRAGPAPGRRRRWAAPPRSPAPPARTAGRRRCRWRRWRSRPPSRARGTLRSAGPAARAEIVAASVGVALGETVGGVGRQRHVDPAGVAEVDVGVVAGGVGGGGDLVDQPQRPRRTTRPRRWPRCGRGGSASRAGRGGDRTPTSSASRARRKARPRIDG